MSEDPFFMKHSHQNSDLHNTSRYKLFEKHVFNMLNLFDKGNYNRFFFECNFSSNAIPKSW